MNAVRSLLLAATLCVTAATAVAAPVKNPLAPLGTGSGLVAGQRLDSGVQAWLGIPFAKPPVQGLRWQPPQPISWQGVWNADRKMPECMQVLRPHNINHYFGEEASSEDCLYMNVWAPADAKPGAKLPVIVFIYGGGSTIGSSGMANYDGEQVARRGAVFVNFNYRVGLLGFMAHPELSREQGGHSGNYAYLDQNAALRWVQANIDKFGGDPARVMIMGQSAGAGSVIQHIFSPLSKGLFATAVMSSGCNWTGPETPLAQGEAIGLEAQKRMGAANLDDMRQFPADKIIGLQAESQEGVNIPGLRAGAVIDGRFMPKSKSAIMEAREMNDVPIIASFNMDESSNALATAKTVDEYREIAAKMYGDKVEDFLKLFPVASEADIRRVGMAAARAAGLETNARTCAQLQAQYNKSPAFINTYARKHPYTPGVKIADQDPVTIGAYHTADIAFWFGTLESLNLFRSTRIWTDWDRDLSAKMMDSLIAFARTGNPATADVKWPAWRAGDERKVIFGDRITIEKLDVKALDFLKANPAKPVQMGPPAPIRPRD